MIKVKCLTGPYAGRVRQMPEEVNPSGLLGDFLEHNWEWQVDYSQASTQETVRWGRVDLLLRALRAIQKGLPVTFLGKVYTDSQELEDTIVLQGAGGVSIARDDETGMEISAHRLPLQEPWITLSRAQMLILEKMPQASEYKKEAFARAVAALVAGLPLGTAGGPTVREYAALREHGRQDEDGKFIPLTFEEAVEALLAEDGVIFGEIAEVHCLCWEEEYCCYDDPQDVAELTRRTGK